MPRDGDGTLYPGRPDLGSGSALADYNRRRRSFAKRHPAFVFSVQGRLVHRLAAVELTWYSPEWDALRRLNHPRVTAVPACGSRLPARRAVGVDEPAPGAFVCARCLGTGNSTFGRDAALPDGVRTGREASRLARNALGGRVRPARTAHNAPGDPATQTSAGPGDRSNGAKCGPPPGVLSERAAETEDGDLWGV